MPPDLRLLPCAFVLFAVLGCASATQSADQASGLTFEQHIRPIFRAHCFDCHGAQEKKEGGLDLRLVRFQVKGGESGPAIVPGMPAESYLLDRLRKGEMPPKDGKLPAKEIAVIEQWIAAGAKTKRPEPESIPPGLGVSDEDRAWWAFQPIGSPKLESIPSDSRLRGTIDALLRSYMPKFVSFSPDADRSTLLKRASFDLLGLPPGLEEIDDFVSDQSPDAYERRIDRLLASPHYGERWARHWLDVAGYADSEGGTAQDASRPWAYKYRDYVIRAFNADKSFDRFIHEQLAGDELAGPIAGDLTPEQIELLSATGYLRMAADGTGSGDDSPEAKNQVVADTIKIVTTSLMGMTVACAQCHDHRYDPISQADYYSLRAIFEPALDWREWKSPQARLISLYTDADRKRAAEVEAKAQAANADKEKFREKYIAEALEKELTKFQPPLREQLKAAYTTPADKRSPEQKTLLEQNPSVNINGGNLYQYNQKAADEIKKLEEGVAKIRAEKPAEEFLHALVEPPDHPVETHRFHRGDYRQPQEAVLPAMFAVLAPVNSKIEFPSKSVDRPTTGRRLALAKWLTGDQNPLTPRVIANRVWMHHFGRGLVATPADFGRLGTPPTHPELLDWLAAEFRSSGWSLKQFHREIMASTAYRQASQRDKNPFDPENHYYGRQLVTRLDAESLVDRVLVASGSLDDSMFGPPVGVKADDSGQVEIDTARDRRTLYTLQRRSQPVALLQAFDAPVMQTNCESRPSSTVATQSLMLMNGSFLLQQSSSLADRAIREFVEGSAQGLAEGIPDIGGDQLVPMWQFGYGSFDGNSGKTTFTPLSHWTGSSWQGGKDLPDPKIGWVLLHANGGHPGANPEYFAIRRWNVPASGKLSISGALAHSSENGDGVRGRIVSSRAGLLGEWSVHHGDAKTEVADIPVQAGDAIDFVADGREHVTSDSFSWEVHLWMTSEDRTQSEWDSASGFHGPLPANTPIPAAAIVRAWQLAYLRNPTRDERHAASAFVLGHLELLRSHPDKLQAGKSPEQQSLANLAQVLLSSNEFLYVD